MEIATTDASAKPLLYIILGTTGSGRREVLADLIGGGLGTEARPVVLRSDNDGGEGIRWSLMAGGALAGGGGGEAVIDAEVPAGSTHVFFLTDGRANPVDQLEAIKPWAAAAGLEVARVITVVNCQLAERHPALLAWYDACIHFSDIALLHKREGVANKWMSDFQGRYRDQFYPCLFEMVKQGRVHNPVLILEPEARRMSHVFDEDEWAGISLEGVEFGTEDDEGDDSDEAPGKRKNSKNKGKGQGKTKTAGGKNDTAEDDDDGMDLPEVDPYFERHNGGRRVKQIPDIAQFLE